MTKRTETRPIKVGNVQVGGQNKCIIQSMTNTKTKDILKTVEQINELAQNGCQIVRLAVLDMEDAQAIDKIKKFIKVPIVADIHYNINLAIECALRGIDKIRINPGNISDHKGLVKLVNLCKEKNIPIRIGINSGSLDKKLLRKYGKVCPEAMIESAIEHTKILEDLDFHDICLSFKSSDVMLTIEVYRLASKTFNYPLHLGVTEAGSYNLSAIKSSAALGTLLHDGIGDTFRISVSADPVQELSIAKNLLNCFDLIEDVPNLVSCPTCGRIQYQMLPIVDEIEKFLRTIKSNLSVAIMGCPVNGPGEASSCDIGIAGGKDSGMLFKKGKFVKYIPTDQMVDELKKEILLMIDHDKNTNI